MFFYYIFSDNIVLKHFAHYPALLVISSMQKYGCLKNKNLQNLSLPHKHSFGLSRNPMHYKAQGRLHERIVTWDQALQFNAFLCCFTPFFSPQRNLVQC